jgi:hypothetical protein
MATYKYNSRGGFALLKEFVENFMIFMDTSGLMQPQTEYFMGNVRPLLIKNKKSIYVTTAVIKELERHASRDEPDPENPEAKPAAQAGLDIVNEMMASGLVKIHRETNAGSFADNELLLVFTRLRINQNLLLITHDKGLTHDISALNDSRAVERKLHIAVHSINENGFINAGKNESTVAKVFPEIQEEVCLEIPEGTTHIQDGEYMERSDFHTVKIPDTVTEIGAKAFSGCSKLKSVTIPNSVTTIGDLAFADCTSMTSVTIPHSVTHIGDSAFSNCKILKSIIIPNSVTHIGDSAFSNCANLKSVTIPDRITHIGDFAFMGCTALENIELPESIISIGENAFSNCESLAEITIPNNVKSIGCGAFYYCISLSNINIVSADTSIDNKDYFKEIPEEMPENLREHIIKNLEQEIANAGDTNAETFEYCSNLTIHTVPGGKAWQYAEKNNIKHKTLH